MAGVGAHRAVRDEDGQVAGVTNHLEVIKILKLYVNGEKAEAIDYFLWQLLVS